MSKRALLVGINQFAGRPEWVLRGCVNDSQAMKQLLEEVYGFTEIRVLNDADATRQGIEEGLAWLLSDYEGGGKDVRVFHFASHGTQVATQAGDDVEEDQLDEVIVPHDHDWDKPFRDDELRAIFDNIPDDVNFTFIADCCHSGSVDKDVFPQEWDVRPRRVEPPAEMQTRINRIAARRLEEETRWIDARVAEELAGLTFRERRQQERGLRERLKALFWREKKKLIPAQRQTLLAACEDVQTAADAFIDGQYRGAFTWSVVQAVREANGAITYGDLIARSAALLKDYTQNPQLACPDDMRDRLFLSPRG